MLSPGLVEIWIHYANIEKNKYLSFNLSSARWSSACLYRIGSKKSRVQMKNGSGEASLPEISKSQLKFWRKIFRKWRRRRRFRKSTPEFRKIPHETWRLKNLATWNISLFSFMVQGFHFGLHQWVFQFSKIFKKSSKFSNTVLFAPVRSLQARKSKNPAIETPPQPKSYQNHFWNSSFSSKF